MIRFFPSVVFVFLTALAFGQLPSSQCDSAKQSVEKCPYVIAQSGAVSQSTTAKLILREYASSASLGETTAEDASGGEMFVQSPVTRKQKFHWGRALFESFTFLSIEQAYVVHEDYRWVVIENGIPFNHYWRDYN